MDIYKPGHQYLLQYIMSFSLIQLDLFQQKDWKTQISEFAQINEYILINN